MTARHDERSGVQAWMQTLQANQTDDFKQTMQVNGDTDQFQDTEADELPPVVRAMESISVS